MSSNHLILCHPHLLPPSVIPSIRVFSNESTLHIRWPKCCSFSFRISPSKECSGLVFIRMDWLELLAIQGTLKSLLQHHSSKASILPCLAFFIVQLSHPYMTTGKTKPLTRRTFVVKVMFLLFNVLSRLDIIFLSTSKCLNFMAVVTNCSDFGAPFKNTVCYCFCCYPSICHVVMGPDAMILVLWMFHFKPTFSLSFLTFIRRLFSSSFSAINMVSSAYLKLLIFLLAVLIPACASSSPAFHMMYSAYELNNQGDNIQPWRPPFPIWNQSVVPCPVLTVAPWPAYRFLQRQVRWSGIPISFRIFHRTEKGQFSFQSQRKAMPKNAQTTAQLHSSHTLVK